MNTTFDFYTAQRTTAPRLARPLGELFARVWLTAAAALRHAAERRSQHRLAAAQARDAATLRGHARSLEQTDPSLARELYAAAARYY